MVLHIFNNQKKFSKGYFQFLKDNDIDLSGHELVHYGNKDSFFHDTIGINTVFIRNFFSPKNIILLKKLREADRIIIHSLASPALLAQIAASPNLAKRCVWIIWGKDLYFL